jgi:BirA family biotin operon repressor/biotin-[acetyl-CoA-carboxylase] ligase
MNDKTFTEKMAEFSKSIPIDFVKKLFVFDEISSTNSTAKDLARTGAEEGTVVVARTQKKGRGRFDRIWESPDGGLYLSVILRPDVSPDRATVLPLVAALAVSKTINQVGLSSQIKWPNDVRIRGKKVAGILVESETDEKQLQYVIVGIGVNVNTDIHRFPREFRHVTTSLSEELNTSVDYHQFLKKLLTVFGIYYTLFTKGEFDRILTEWKKQSDTLGRKVKIITSTGEIIGEACDVDQSGFLLVVTDAGDRKTITSGDCLYCDELEV